MSNQVFKVTPRTAREFVTDALYADLVPFLHSSPGMGKSSIIKSLSREMNLKVIDHRLSTSEPTDMSGLPDFDDDGYAYFAPFAGVFPIEGLQLPDDPAKPIKGRDKDGKEAILGYEKYEGWNLFLDELPAATRAVQAAAFKLILDKMVGQNRLHDKVVITAAGNLITDRSVVNPLVTAMQSRLVHLEMEVNHEEWLKDVAIPENYDSRIIGYLMQFPGKLMDFKPDHHDKTFACPRTWEFLNRQLRSYAARGKDVTKRMLPLIAGEIGQAVAVDFMEFVELFSKLTPLSEICRDPRGAPVPQAANIKWATCSSMLQNVNEDNFGQLSVYADRFDLSFRLLFYRFVLVHKPLLRTHPDFGPSIGRIVQHLNPSKPLA